MALHPPTLQLPLASPRLPSRTLGSSRNIRFRNPFLRVEVELVKAIASHDSRHNPTSTRKRRLLCDALRDLSDIPSPFRRHILSVATDLTPMQDERRVLFRTSVGCDILRQTGDLSAAADSTRSIESQVTNLRDELARIEAETSRLHDEAVEMRRRVAEDSERFARARAARDRLARINEDFEAMFVRKTESPPAEIAAMLCNRDENRRLLERKKSELEVVRQITRRMKFYEQNH
jgi:hypothetical protein